jgi:hypothetical protein
LIGGLKGSLEEQLRVLGHAGIEGIKSKEDLIRVGLAEHVMDPDASTMTWQGPSDAFKMLSDFMRKRIDVGELHGDPEMLARIFMSFWFAYVLGRKLWDDGGGDTPAMRDRVVNSCVDLFLSGSRAR